MLSCVVSMRRGWRALPAQGRLQRQLLLQLARGSGVRVRRRVGAEAERARIFEIEAVCRKYKLPDELRSGLVKNGATIEQARMAAADEVMVPIQCEYYALEGLSDLVNTIKKVRTHLNPTLEIEGLLRTMFDNRNMLAQQVSAQLVGHFGDKVYSTLIPRNVRLAEAPSYGMPALIYDKSSKGAQAYLQLAKEILDRENAKQKAKQ